MFSDVPSMNSPLTRIWSTRPDSVQNVSTPISNSAVPLTTPLHFFESRRYSKLEAINIVSLWKITTFGSACMPWGWKSLRCRPRFTEQEWIWVLLGAGEDGNTCAQRRPYNPYSSANISYLYLGFVWTWWLGAVQGSFHLACGPIYTNLCSENRYKQPCCPQICTTTQNKRVLSHYDRPTILHNPHNNNIH